MREIIFRGKRVDNGEWVYGCLINTEIGVCIHSSDMFYETRTFLDGEALSAQMELVRVSPETIFQYTGLTDKNGVKIFEGDIMLMPSYQGGKHRSVVYFKNGKFAVNGSNYHFKDIKPRNIEVIGNIFDNLELMEV